jgi:hypothetical protein
MPIRFRCVYCEQLLGIARRKSGTVVKCPNCAGQLIVPLPESDDDDAGPDAPTASTDDVGGSRRAVTQMEKTAPAPVPVPVREPQATVSEAGMLFERSDFDELLKPALERKPSLPAKSNPSGHARRSAPFVPTVEPAPAVSHAAAPFDFAHQPAAPAAPVYAPSPASAQKSGIVLTPVKLLLLAMLVLFGIGLAFTGGLLLGWYLHK